MKNIIFSLFVAFSILSAIFGAQWTIDESTEATIVMGLGVANDGLATAATSANSVGAFVQRYHNGSWSKTEKLDAGMILDAAVTPSGNTLVSSSWNTFLSTDNGKTYKTVPVQGIAYAVYAWGPNKENLAVVGSLAVPNPDGSSKPIGINGLTYSRDAGATWTMATPIEQDWSRYAAFPSDQIWYVSSGMYPTSSSAAASTPGKQEDRTHHVRHRMSLSSKGFQINENSHNLKLKFKADNETTTGWNGAVSKTTDGGQTWTTVLATNPATDYFYFNGISCISDTQCVVVGEGYDIYNNNVWASFAHATFDGGVTWSRTLYTDDTGIATVKFVNEQEVWIGATKQDGRKWLGQFYRSMDGGKTFQLFQSLDSCLVVDLDFGETVGMAACISSSLNSGYIAVYK